MLWTLCLLLSAAIAPAEAARVKDVSSFSGVRKNTLSGIGLVVGLNRTGDSAANEAAIALLTQQLQARGIQIPGAVNARNVAVVAVTAEMNAYHQPGSRLDVTVASTGDAFSLEGGVLMPTLLRGLDQRVYAVADGELVIGGYQVGAGGALARKNHTTTGMIVAGGVVEQPVASAPEYLNRTEAELILNTPDFSNARRIADVINADFGAAIAQPVGPSTLKLSVPAALQTDFPTFASRVESLQVTLDTPARIVVNERTGTVVIGANVQIAPTAIAHGGLTIEVMQINTVSQPNALAQGQTVLNQNFQITASEKDGDLRVVDGAEIGQLVAALNDMGVSPRDLIIILQTLHAAGAIHAEITTQ